MDHGIMVENWQEAIGSEGRSPLLKNDSSGTKSSGQTDTHIQTPREEDLMKLCSSTSLGPCPGPDELRSRAGQVISGCMTHQHNEVSLLTGLRPVRSYHGTKVTFICCGHVSALLNSSPRQDANNQEKNAHL